MMNFQDETVHLFSFKSRDSEVTELRLVLWCACKLLCARKCYFLVPSDALKSAISCCYLVHYTMFGNMNILSQKSEFSSGITSDYSLINTSRAFLLNIQELKPNLTLLRFYGYIWLKKLNLFILQINKWWGKKFF